MFSFKLGLFLFIPLFCFVSCGEVGDDEYIINSKTSKDAWKYEVRIDSMQISIDSSFNNTYHTYATFDDNGVDYLFGYNSSLSTIDIFDLTSRGIKRKLDLQDERLGIIGLDKQDLDKNRSITDINVVNFDSILLNVSNHNLVMIDTNLKRKISISLDSISVKNNISGKAISYSHEFKMFFWNDKLILNQIYNKHNWSEKLPVFVGLNIRNEKLSFIPIAYSDYLYKIEGKAGFLTSIVTSDYQKPGVLTYGYLYESNIYQYNPKNSTVVCYGGSPEKGKNLVDSIDYKDGDDPKKWVTHHIENTQFFNVMYDKYRHLYYRFSLRNISQNNGKYFNSILDKPLVLMVFNEKFEIIKELELPRYRYAPNTWFITKEGLFISPTHKKNKFVDPSHLKFDIIKIYDSTVHGKNS